MGIKSFSSSATLNFAGDDGGGTGVAGGATGWTGAGACGYALIGRAITLLNAIMARNFQIKFHIRRKLCGDSIERARSKAAGQHRCARK